MKNTDEMEIEDLMEVFYGRGVDEKTAVTISVMVRRPGARPKLMQWMETHNTANTNEILRMARKLRNESMR